MDTYAYDYRINQVATGRAIKNARLSCGYSVEKVAHLFGCAFQTVYRWENGTAIPSMDNLFAMKNLFRVSMDKLIVGERITRDVA